MVDDQPDHRLHFGMASGADDLGYVTCDAISSSRLGLDYISVPTPGSIADEFPGIVGHGRIQYSTPLGGLETNNRVVAGVSRVRASDNQASNFGVGGSGAREPI